MLGDWHQEFVIQNATEVYKAKIKIIILLNINQKNNKTQPTSLAIQSRDY